MFAMLLIFPAFCFFLFKEPGYYEENEFGMRIEDVVQVVSAENIPNNFGGRGAYRLKTVTYVPIQAKLINTDLITPEEVNLMVHLIIYVFVS